MTADGIVTRVWVMRTPTVKPRVVRTLRENATLSIAALARLADISPGYLSHIESGRRNPSLLVTLRLANALRVPVEAISDVNPLLIADMVPTPEVVADAV